MTLTTITRKKNEGTRRSDVDDERPIRLRDIDGDPATWRSRVVEDMTFEVINAKHNYFTVKWKHSPTYRACSSALNETVMVQKNLNITQCMCLGLGTFTGDDTKNNNDEEDRDSSLMQLVAFECMVAQLKSKFMIEKIYFQDPAFNILDEELLMSKGYEILQTPQSDDCMNETAFLFTPRVELPVEESSLAAAELRQMQETVQVAEVGGRRKLLNSYLSQHAAISLPDSASDYWFHGMRIYYKPDSEADVSPVELELKGKSYTYKQSRKLWRRKGFITSDFVCSCCNEREGDLSPDSSDAEDEPSLQPKSSHKISHDEPILSQDMESLTIGEEETSSQPTSPHTLDTSKDDSTVQNTGLNA